MRLWIVVLYVICWATASATDSNPDIYSGVVKVTAKWMEKANKELKNISESGTGFLIHEDKKYYYVLTLSHVIDEIVGESDASEIKSIAKDLKVQFVTGAEISAEVVFYEKMPKSSGFALLKIPKLKGLNPYLLDIYTKPALYAEVKAAEKLLAIGFPKTVIIHKETPLTYHGLEARAIQFNPELPPGYSGAPVILPNTTPTVVGISAEITSTHATNAASGIAMKNFLCGLLPPLRNIPKRSSDVEKERGRIQSKKLRKTLVEIEGNKKLVTGTVVASENNAIYILSPLNGLTTDINDRTDSLYIKTYKSKAQLFKPENTTNDATRELALLTINKTHHVNKTDIPFYEFLNKENTTCSIIPRLEDKDSLVYGVSKAGSNIPVTYKNSSGRNLLFEVTYPSQITLGSPIVLNDTMIGIVTDAMAHHGTLEHNLVVTPSLEIREFLLTSKETTTIFTQKEKHIYEKIAANKKEQQDFLRTELERGKTEQEKNEREIHKIQTDLDKIQDKTSEEAEVLRQEMLLLKKENKNINNYVQEISSKYTTAEEEINHLLRIIDVLKEEVQKFSTPSPVSSDPVLVAFTMSNKKELAAYLTELGYFKGGIKNALLEDVQSALKLFQADMQQSETGLLTEPLWSKLQTIDLSPAVKRQLTATTQESSLLKFDDPPFPKFQLGTGNTVYAIDRIDCQGDNYRSKIFFYKGILLSTKNSLELPIQLTEKYLLWYDRRYDGLSTQSWRCMPKQRFCYSPIQFSDWHGKTRIGDIIDFSKKQIIPVGFGIPPLAAKLSKQHCDFSTPPAANRHTSSSQTIQPLIVQFGATPTTNGVVITLGGVLFETGQANVLKGAQRKLNQLAAYLKELDYYIKIEGHTDSHGDPTSNLTLSEKRANAVKTLFIHFGISANRLCAKGLGEEFPIASNKTESGRQQNRRVEITILDMSTAQSSLADACHYF